MLKDCTRHQWKDYEKYHSYFGDAVRCPFCQMEEDREQAIRNAEAFVREANEEQANYWWRVAEATGEKVASAFQEHKHGLPPDVRESITQRQAHEFLRSLSSDGGLTPPGG